MSIFSALGLSVEFAVLNAGDKVLPLVLGEGESRAGSKKRPQTRAGVFCSSETR